MPTGHHAEEKNRDSKRTLLEHQGMVLRAEGRSLLHSDAAKYRSCSRLAAQSTNKRQWATLPRFAPRRTSASTRRVAAKRGPPPGRGRTAVPTARGKGRPGEGQPDIENEEPSRSVRTRSNGWSAGVWVGLPGVCIKLTRLVRRFFSPCIFGEWWPWGSLVVVAKHGHDWLERRPERAPSSPEDKNFVTYLLC